MKYCNACGNELNGTSNFCNHCGNSLVKNDIKESTISSKNFCDECGSKDIGFRFCKSCGNNMIITHVIINSPQNKKPISEPLADKNFNSSTILYKINRKLTNCKVPISSKTKEKTMRNLERLRDLPTNTYNKLIIFLGSESTIKTAFFVIFCNYIVFLLITPLIKSIQSVFGNVEQFNQNISKDFLYRPPFMINTIIHSIKLLNSQNNFENSKYIIILITIFVLLLGFLNRNTIKKTIEKRSEEKPL